MRELFRCFAIGAMTIGIVAALVWGFNHVVMPLFLYSVVFRYMVGLTFLVLVVTWLGAAILYGLNYPFEHAFAGSDAEIVYVGDGVSGE